MLPSQVARDLDEDPEQLSLECMVVLNYIDVKRAIDRAGAEGPGDAIDRHPLAATVRENMFDLGKERIARRRAQAEEASRG